MMKRFLIIAVAAFLPAIVSAQVKMSQLFSDNMVLQRNSEVPVWGTAVPGHAVTVKTSWDGNEYTVVPGEDGKWKVKVNTPEAGGPFTITISQKRKTVTLSNIMSGDVWLCSGQSNMEMPVKDWGKVDNYAAELKEANQYPALRFLNLKKTFSSVPADDFEVMGDYGWHVCDERQLVDFSACAYFFGRELYKDLDIPIGLINTSYGGTCIEPWISSEAMAEFASEQEFIESGRKSAEVRGGNLALFNEKWRDALDAADLGMKDGKPIWAASDFDDSDWKTTYMPAGIERSIGWFDGCVWLRKEVDIPESFAGKKLSLCLGRVQDEDITYFNGVRIGATSGYGLYRKYQIPAGLVKQGKALVTVRCVDGLSDAGIIGDDERILLVCGKDTLDLAGKWKYCIGATYNKVCPETEYGIRPDFSSELYNAMIYPLVPFTVKGVLWYQGESNTGNSYQYREALPVLIHDWREKWACELPFYIVQIANFATVQTNPDERSGWAELREAQTMAANTVDNTYQAVTIDIGMEKDIHPKNKQELGRRLALLARKYTYGRDIKADSPQMESYTIEGSSVRIRFRNAESLKVSGNVNEVKGFVIAGSDHKFHFADARIEGNTVVVSCPEVKYPVAVRYAWATNPVCNLYNEADLPVCPFRTDDWQGATYGKRLKY